jgi:hypothetical protein
MTDRSVSVGAGPRVSTPELDSAIAAAERDAIVVWRGERIPFASVPSRIARIDARQERDGLYSGWIDGVEAVNPLYADRLAAWREQAGPVTHDIPPSLSGGRDLQAVARETERLAIDSETVYHAALRRYLALVGIEQGDGTLADLWHIQHGSAWSQWFGTRDVDRAATGVGRVTSGRIEGDGWRAAESRLVGSEPLGSAPAAAVAELYGTLIGNPSWLSGVLRVAPDEISAFADFAAFVRLYRLRRTAARFQFEMRLYRVDDDAIMRAYFSGIVGHMVGVSVADAAYLRDVGAPFSSVDELERTVLAGAIGESLENRFGEAWWSDERGRNAAAAFAGVSRGADVLAQLGYDAWDWRPVLRQIRTRLIGEMSGYGGPNITTRAGTRKV